MKNTVFIKNIIKALFLLMILIFVFIKNEQLYLRLFILSFILLTICNIAKNICNLLNKPKIANIFHKLFIIIFITFAIVFLIVWSLVEIKNKQYFYLVFTIPFWALIVYMIHKFFFSVNSNSKKSEKKDGFNLKIVVSYFLVASVLLVGIICLFIGIKDTYYANKKTENYLITTAYYNNYEIYDSNDRNNTTYRLIYVYEVNDNKYTIKTDYGSGYIPDMNSGRKIKYNPKDPSEAIFIGTNKNSMLIYFGTFFLLGGMVFVLGFLYIWGVFDKIKINILGIYIGIVFLIVGIGIIGIQLREVSSLISIIKQMKFWILIPIMFIIVGFFQIVKCLFFEQLKISNEKKLSRTNYYLRELDK